MKEKICLLAPGIILFGVEKKNLMEFILIIQDKFL